MSDSPPATTAPPTASDFAKSDFSGRHGQRALEVARGVCRLFARNGVWLIPEVSLRNNRRADLMGVNAKGEVIVVEIKVSRADLLGDQKWPEYLDYCDRFFWAVPAGFDFSPIAGEAFMPERTGLIAADAYDAEIVRSAALVPLAAARRKVEVQRLARLAMRRLMAIADPDPALAVIEAE